MRDMLIKVQVYKEGRQTKDETFYDPIDMIAWVCRCYQAAERAARAKVLKAKIDEQFRLERQAKKGLLK